MPAESARDGVSPKYLLSCGCVDEMDPREVQILGVVDKQNVMHYSIHHREFVVHIIPKFFFMQEPRNPIRKRRFNSQRESNGCLGKSHDSPARRNRR
jgi:hypothetical protein